MSNRQRYPDIGGLDNRGAIVLFILAKYKIN